MADPDDRPDAPSSGAPDHAVADADSTPSVGGDSPSETTDTDPDSTVDDRRAAAGPADPSDGDGTSGDPPDGDDLKAYTTDRRTLSSRVRVQWGTRVLVATLVLGLVLSTAAGRLTVDPRLGGLAALALGLLGLGWVALRYRVWVYEVRTDALYLQRGVVTHTRTLAPYVRIQHVDTSRSPLERWLGLSTLVVYTAGSRGADVSVPGLTPEEATDLQRRLKELAIEAEGGDAL